MPLSNATASPAPLVDAAWRAYSLPSHSLRIYLPEGQHWTSHVDGTFWRARHEATDSTLLVKRWREGRLVDARDCEQQALLWKPVMQRPHVVALQDSRLQTLGGYHAHASTYIDTEPKAGLIQGTLIAHGASVRDCFSFWFSTRANVSPQSAEVVRTRLQLMYRALQRLERNTAADQVGAPREPAL